MGCAGMATTPKPPPLRLEDRLMFELALCTKTLLTEIQDRRMYQKDVALTYAMAIESNDDTDWRTVNEAIIKRWSMSGLERVKKMAWKLDLAAAREELDHYRTFGHRFGCPKCKTQLTTLLFCGNCGIRYELREGG